ncbi:MAG: MFS transporter [Xenococcaceae cyanobacterium]
MKAQENSDRVIPVLLASVLIDFVAAGIAIPLLPFYAQSFGASPVIIGLLFSVFFFMELFAPPIWGSLSDRIGRRPALLFNIAGTSFSYLWFGLASSLWMLFVARALAGAASSSIVIAQSYIADVTTSENRTKSLGLLQAAGGIGFLIGPAIGSFLAGTDPDNPNFHLPGLTAAGVSLLTFCFAWMTLPRVETRKSSAIMPTTWKPRSWLTSVTVVLRRPLVGLLIGILALGTFGTIGVQITLPLWCKEQFGWGPQQFSYLVIFYCVLIAVIQIFLIGPLTRWFEEARLMLWGLVAVGIGRFLIPFSSSWFLLVGTFAIIASAQAVSSPAFYSLLSQLSGAKQQGKTLGLAKSTTSLANLIGGIGAGFIYEVFGPNWPFWGGSLLILGATAFSWQRITHSRLSAIAHKRRQQKLTYLFDVLDVDKNGTIELIDFEQVVQNIAQLRGWRIGTQKYEILHSSWVGFGEWLQDLADRTRDGHIDLDEWLACLDKRLDYEFSEALIKLMDANDDGKIAIEELKVFYQTYQIDTDHVEEVFENLDRDRDTHISPDEMKEIVSEFLYSDDTQVSGNWFLGVSVPRKL